MELMKFRAKRAHQIVISAWVDEDRDEVLYTPLNGGNEVHEMYSKFLIEWEPIEPSKDRENER